MTIPSKTRLLSVAKIRVDCERDPESFVGNCSAIDPATDKATEDYIRKELADGNDWAWCIVTVTASWGGLSCSDSLCGCSYASLRDFERDMLPDLKDNACELLHEALTDKRRRDRASR